ncbi:MAG TPA: tripartite tricarboxylate transporter substrate-binding protein [Burkholderiales bacterium]|nr:tripartite tricarboxylate transporter substrate-binding protein [Burkholderiales bacterium]
MQRAIAVVVVSMGCVIASDLACSAAPAAPPASTGAAPVYPNRPIRLVVASTAGGSPDTIARVVGRAAESYLGQSFIVDNRGGANGIVGAQIVASAAPDGYTLLHTAPAVLLNPMVYKKLPYDVERDLLPVTQIAAGMGYLMLVSPASPVNSVKEFIALAKQKPLRYGAPPIGGTTWLAGELFNVHAGVQLNHVPYRGGNEAVIAVMSGEADVTFSPPTASLSFVQAGKLRALGFSGSKRFSKLPDVPLISEAGVPTYIVDFTWNAWFAPAKTPPAIVNKWHAAVREALKQPKIQAFLDTAAFYPVGSTPEEFRVFVAAELKRYSQNLREAKFVPQ